MRPAKRILSAIVLAIALSSTGCGMLIAEIDTTAALAEVEKINVANWKTAAVDKSNAHLRAAAKLEIALKDNLRASSGGPKAVEIFESYRKMKLAQETAAALEMSRYAEALDNALLGRELVNGILAIRSRWNALVGKFPAATHLRAVAEVEARRYVNAIGKDTRSNP